MSLLRTGSIACLTIALIGVLIAPAAPAAAGPVPAGDGATAPLLTSAQARRLRPCPPSCSKAITSTSSGSMANR